MPDSAHLTVQVVCEKGMRMDENPREAAKKTDAAETWQPRNQNEGTQDAGGERRRALLLGLAALPAIITITNRPLWAASGNLSGGSGANQTGGQQGAVSLQQLQPR